MSHLVFKLETFGPVVVVAPLYFCCQVKSSKLDKKRSVYTVMCVHGFSSLRLFLSASMLARWWLAMEALCLPWRRGGTWRPGHGLLRLLSHIQRLVRLAGDTRVVFKAKWTTEERYTYAKACRFTFLICFHQWGSCTGSSWGQDLMSCRRSRSTPVMTNWRTGVRLWNSLWVPSFLLDFKDLANVNLPLEARRLVIKLDVHCRP